MNKYLSVLTVLSLMTNLFWIGATQASDTTVRDCELYVDDLSIQTTGIYGTGHLELVANLTTRNTASVIGVGGYFRYSEKKSEIQYDATGKPTGTLNDEGIREEIIAGKKLRDGRFSVSLTTEWNEYDRRIGNRTILNFVYYVDIASNNTLVRYWLKNETQDFTADDISPDRYFYSDSVFLGGYTSAKYLWRDSGSPLFAQRTRCVAR